MDLLNQVIDEPSTPVPDARKWSDHQVAVFDRVKDPGNILIQAVAGSGKTTTIIKAIDHAPGSSIFLAFNKSIAEEIKAKQPGGEVKTLNALGHGLVRQNAPHMELNTKKNQDIVAGLLGPEDLKDYGYTVQRLIGLAKNCALGLSREPHVQDFEDLIDGYQFDVPTHKLDHISEVGLRAFRQSIAHADFFDFDDQLYLPLRWEWKYPHYSNAFVDECQDLSPIQHLMLNQLAVEGARITAVGDRHQAIYGFRGAMTDSMDALKGRFSMHELPLSTTYRCDRDIVEEAQIYCPHIMPREGAGKGEVIYADQDPNLFRNALVVCRNNAPLFRAILRHVRAKEPCRVLSNFMDSLQSFIRSFKAKNTSQLQDKLDVWFEREKEAAEKKGFKGKIAGLEDKYQTVSLFCAEYESIEEILMMIKRLAYGVTGPTFATIHKAKGLEHENVHIIRPDLMPAKYAQSPEAKQQEANMTYVAVTRAKHKLTYGEML